MKIISLNLLNDKTAIQKEVLIHKTLNNENVIKYFSSFQQLDKFYIILEYASGGELFDRIEPDFGMNVDLAHKYFCQLINGVEYLHSKGIVHRDLKPENLLLNDNDLIKIADFGLATLFQYKGNERLLTSPCGTGIISFSFFLFNQNVNFDNKTKRLIQGFGVKLKILNLNLYTKIF